MKIFLDWGITKGHTIALDDGLVYSMVPSKVLLEILSQLLPSEIYLETGCPKQELRIFKEFGHSLYEIDAKVVMEFRVKEKTDINDALLLKEIYEQKSKLFKEVSFKEEVLSELMRRYDKITKICVSLKNQYVAYVREYGETEGLETIGNLIDILENNKANLLSQAYPLIQEHLHRLNIKGVGVRYLAGILAYAHPSNFRCLSTYLSYCGYKGGVGSKYNRDISSFANRMAVSVIMARDDKFYPFYLEVKERIVRQHPDYTKARINRMSINRLATFLLKEIYWSIKGREIIKKT